MTQGKLVDLLKRLGLDAMEVTMYTALERSEVSTGPELCERTGIPPSKAYGILRSLESLGIVSTVHGRPMKFIAEPVERALARLVDLRRREFLDLGAEARLIVAQERAKGEKITGNLRMVDDEEIRKVCREIASSRFQSKVVLTSEGEEVLRVAGSRLGIDLLGLIRAEWKARDIEGQIVRDPSQGMSYAVMDGSTVHLFLPGPGQATMIVTLNSSPLADAFLTMDGNNKASRSSQNPQLRRDINP